MAHYSVYIFDGFSDQNSNVSIITICWMYLLCELNFYLCWIFQDGWSAERWLRIVLAMIIALVCQGKEDSVLSRLEELQLCVHQQGDDPLNVTAAKLNHPPQLIFAKYEEKSFVFSVFIYYILLHFRFFFVKMLWKRDFQRDLMKKDVFFSKKNIYIYI